MNTGHCSSHEHTQKTLIQLTVSFTHTHVSLAIWRQTYHRLLYLYKGCQSVILTVFISTLLHINLQENSMRSLNLTLFRDLGSVKIVFLKNSLLRLPRLHLFDQKQHKNSDIKYYQHIFYMIYFKCNLFLIAKLITPVFSVTWTLRNHSNRMIYCTRNISYYQCWKLNILYA